MAISYVDVTAPAVASGTTYTVDKPAGVVAGDLMLMFINLVNVVAPRYPDGWVEVPRAYYVESQWGFTVLGKIAGASEPISYTLTYGVSTGTAAGIVAFRSGVGAHMRVPVATTITGTPSGSGPYIRAWPQVTVDVAALVAYFGTYSWASTPVGGETERWDGAGSGVQRPYLMTGSGGPGLTPAAEATAGLSSTFRNATIPIIESDPVPYPGPQYISVASAEGAVDGSQSVTLPTDIQTGDMLIAQITTTNAKTYTFPAGWVAVDDVTVGGAEGMFAYVKTAAAEDAGATLSVTFAAGSTRCALGVTTFRSLRGRTLAIEIADSQTNSSSTTITFPSLSTAFDNAMYLYMAAMPINTNIGDPMGAPLRYALASSIVSYQIRAYTRHAFGAGAHPFTPTVSSANASIAATIVIVELEPPRREYMIGIGHDLDIDDLSPIVPQLHSPGVMYTRRLPSGNDGVFDEGPFVPLEWNVLQGSALYQSLLSQFGLDAAKMVAVTIVARDEVWNWARFNGYAVQPLPGEDIVWDRFYPQGVAILVVELELIEVYE